MLHGKARNGGYARVLIDGTAHTQLSFRSKGAARGVSCGTLRTFGRLGAGEHTVTIVMRRVADSATARARRTALPGVVTSSCADYLTLIAVR